MKKNDKNYLIALSEKEERAFEKIDKAIKEKDKKTLGDFFRRFNSEDGFWLKAEKEKDKKSDWL